MIQAQKDILILDECVRLLSEPGEEVKIYKSDLRALSRCFLQDCHENGGLPWMEFEGYKGKIG